MRRHRSGRGKTSRTPRPSEEEEQESGEDEEWTPGPSGGQVTEGVAAVCSGDRKLRKRDNIDYTEQEVPTDEHYYFCDQCREFFLEECDKHGRPRFIEDRRVAVGQPDRAEKTLPPRFEIKRSGIPNAGLGVFYCGVTKLCAGTHFGPYEGVKTGKDQAVDSGYSWVIRRERNRYDYIDAEDKTQSNWMRYVNCARNETEQNLIAFQHRGRLLYRCCRPVARGEELLVWYGDEYAKELGIVFDELWDNKSSAKGEESQSSQTQVFSCPGCPYAFTSQVFLHKHLKRSHNDLYWQMLRSGQIPPAAAACQQTSSTSAVPSLKQGDTNQTREVKTHQSYSGKKTHRCKDCDKSFTRLSSLMKHQRIPTGEKPFHCNQCDSSFTESAHLKRHQRIHTGDKTYVCKHCGKGFSQSGHLKGHQRIHTGEKLYVCKHCGKKFNWLCHLRTHQQRIHSGDTSVSVS